MSSKINKTEYDLSTGVVDNNFNRALRHRDVWLNDDGSEIVSPISAVAHVDMFPLTLGERLARFQSLPDPSLWDDDDASEFADNDLAGDDDAPMSPFEDRARHIVEKARETKRKRAQKQADDKKAEDKRKREELSELLRDLKSESAKRPEPKEQPLPLEE